MAERPPPTAAAPGSLVGGLLRLARPKQWVKNVLVFAAPGAAGVLSQADDLAKTVLAFVAFCLAASGTYYLNDAADVEADRHHPTKRFRPVASGAVPVTLARTLGVTLVVAGILVGFATGSWHLPAVVAGYVVLTTSYTIWLKHIAVVDLAAVAAGFVIRAVAGAAATDVEVSDWFLIVACFGSLFMVAGKRYAEMMLAERTGAKIRRSLENYTASYLRFVWALSATVLITTYCLWAFDIGEEQHNHTWSVISIVPFVIAVLRYAVDVDSGNGGEPEEIALGDRVLQVLALLWVGTLTLAVYAGVVGI